jgi:hypothetical protein
MFLSEGERFGGPDWGFTSEFVMGEELAGDPWLIGPS